MKTASYPERALEQLGSRSPLALSLGAVLFAALTALGAAMSFPLAFSLVPVTLQTFFVILSGAVLGPVAGPASQLLYLAAGTAGMPVFAGGTAGPGVLAGPTGGYLIGFVVAAWAAGLMVRPHTTWWKLWPGLIVAHLVVFVFGVSHLLLFTGSDVRSAVELGVWPFLPGLAVKTAAAAGLLGSLRAASWLRSK